MKDLLSVLASMAGCAYISDLRIHYANLLPIHALEELDPSDFTAKQWNEALTYLAGSEAACPDATSARAALIELLRRKGEKNAKSH